MKLLLTNITITAAYKIATILCDISKHKQTSRTSFFCQGVKKSKLWALHTFSYHIKLIKLHTTINSNHNNSLN